MIHLLFSTNLPALTYLIGLLLTSWSFWCPYTGLLVQLSLSLMQWTRPYWTVVLEKTLESPLDCKEIQPVHSEGDQSWVFFGRNDAKAETPVLWPPHEKSWLIGKASDAGRDWGQEEKGTTEDEMAGWQHWVDGRESVWTPGVGDGQGGLTCCDSWGHKESDTTEWLNWTELRPYWGAGLCSSWLLLFYWSISVSVQGRETHFASGSATHKLYSVLFEPQFSLL